MNEWLKAKQLKETHWLYVVWNPTEPNYELITISDPANKLEYTAKEIKTISNYEIDGKEIDKFGGQGDPWLHVGHQFIQHSSQHQKKKRQKTKIRIYSEVM